ncbi:putative peptide maturation dehydrogenase [Stenotrophomonas pennii]|uniref:putative peptide maturation dehydrogenase n=1 Tax=Stenotrophomonas lacuserhaii TaxID=2760084 RepID=UPI003207C48D
MHFRRCSLLMVRVKEDRGLDLHAVLQGRAELQTFLAWQALAGHLDEPVVLSEEELSALGRIPQDAWSEADAYEGCSRILRGLITKGLVISDEQGAAGFRDADERVRALNGWPLTALAHRAGRWRGVDSAQEMRSNNLVTAVELHGRYGPPPAAVSHHEGTPIPLPVAADEDFDELMSRRVTCRNFDPDRPLPLQTAARILKRTIMAHAVIQPAPDMQILKKNIPSGGGLHPLETYAVVRNVEGLGNGVHHYDPIHHSLRRLAAQPDDLDGRVRLMLAGQEWFVDAALHLIQVARFPRNFWKYRSHPKAYRAILLDAGHLSQQLAISATLEGVASYVTAAINEFDIEDTLQLDGIMESPVMMCGIGWRAQRLTTTEFDPAQRIWTDGKQHR